MVLSDPPTARTTEPQTKPVEPIFTFDSILKELEVVVPDEEPSSSAPQYPLTPPAFKQPNGHPQPVEKETGISGPTVTDSAFYLLQVASYRSAIDAERLKAKLALLGIQTRIQAVNIKGKGMHHRVQVGPYQGKESSDEARALLSRNGLESIVIGNR